MIRNKYFLLFFLFTGSQILLAQDSRFFDMADRFFMEHVKKGKINYTNLSEDRSLLDSLTQDIATMDLTWKSKEFEKAFCINAYNILVIKTVLDYYPIKSPKEVDGFFNKIKHKVAGRNVTLDELEFDYVFGKFKDPRIHFVLNCAASSCPTLYDKAIRPAEIEEQLNFSTTMVIDREDYVKVDEKRKVIMVSKIFEWYREMFEAENNSIREFINFNRFTTLPDNYDIKFMEYDWTLNDRL